MTPITPSLAPDHEALLRRMDEIRALLVNLQCQARALREFMAKTAAELGINREATHG